MKYLIGGAEFGRLPSIRGILPANFGGFLFKQGPENITEPFGYKLHSYVALGGNFGLISQKVGGAQCGGVWATKSWAPEFPHRH